MRCARQVEQENESTLILAFFEKLETQTRVAISALCVAVAACQIETQEAGTAKTTDDDITSWSIRATRKGTIAHMHVKTSRRGEQIEIAGYISPTERGRDLFAEEHAGPYYTDETYAQADNEYNGFTLPLRIKWLAVQRSQQIADLYKQEQEISTQENKLLGKAKSCYPDFHKLHIAKHNDYAFSNLDTQEEIKFAGKRLFEHKKITAAIKKIKEKLRDEISYKQLSEECILDDLHTYITTATSTQLPANGTSTPPPRVEDLHFHARARSDDNFKQLAHTFVQLKWARLQLAEALLQLYQPHVFTFYYAIGVNKHFKITAFPDDSRKGDSTLRYEMHATTSSEHQDSKDKEEFTLGDITFYRDDRDLKLNDMWISLKPRGGLSRFAKLTFKPCMPGSQCPTASKLITR